MRAPEGGMAGAVPRASVELLTLALDEMESALEEPRPERRFVRGHLVALRGAAAVLAARARPAKGQSGPRKVWDVLPTVAPELREWAMFFRACSSKQVAAAAGVEHVVTTREADDLLRDSQQFLDAVARCLTPGRYRPPVRTRSRVPAPGGG